MFFSKKRLTLMLSTACLFISLIEYIPYHIFCNTGSTVSEIIYLLFSNAFDLLLPVIFSAMLLARSDELGRGGILLSCLCLSLPRILFYAPYFYMEFFALGFEVTLAVSLAILIGLFFSIGFGLFTLLLYGISILSYKKKCDDYKKGAAPSLSKMLTDGGVFDFSKPKASIIAPAVIVSFILSIPIYRIIEFFISYGGTFIFAEILSIILEIVYLLCLFVLAHFFAVKFVGAILYDEKD